MNKLFSLSEHVAKAVEDFAKNERMTQSRVVESACVLYLAIFQGAVKEKAEDLKADSNQTSIYDFLSRRLGA